MLRYQPIFGYLLILILSAIHPPLTPVFAQDRAWSGELQSGGRVRVDPDTNKATVVTKRGITTPLWDGVHRLQDGSTIIVRDGVMVPTKEVIQLRKQKPAIAVGENPAPCQRLVRKVCGLHGECATREACSPARQLLSQKEQQERQRVAYPGGPETVWAHRRCIQALSNEVDFPACDKLQRGKRPTSCELLSDKICGPNSECSGTEKCSLAEQLLEMETKERQSAPDPDAPTYSSGQCRDALADEAFFSPCQQTTAAPSRQESNPD